MSDNQILNDYLEGRFRQTERAVTRLAQAVAVLGVVCSLLAVALIVGALR